MMKQIWNFIRPMINWPCLGVGVALSIIIFLAVKGVI